MDEIRISENKADLPKVKDIIPNSVINMDDCKSFWNEIFDKEITKNSISSPDISNTKMKFDDKINDIWNDIFREPIEEKVIETDKKGLTQEEKNIIREETGWSDEVISSIRSFEEYKIYKEAGLVEGEVNGKKCLVRSDIDWEQKDQYGVTNRERIAEGYAPLDKTGNPIQLHHIGQRANSPLAELTFREHRMGGNDTILHDKTKETEVHGLGNGWDNERKEYWKNRPLDGGKVDE